MIPRFGLFILSSASSFLVDIGVFYLLYGLVLAQVGQGQLWWAVALARVVSMSWNYLVNGLIVFAGPKTQRLGSGRSLGSYLLLAAVIMVLSYGLTKGLHFLLPAPPVWMLKVVADTGLFLLSYHVQRAYIFKSAAK